MLQPNVHIKATIIEQLKKPVVGEDRKFVVDVFYGDGNHSCPSSTRMARIQGQHVESMDTGVGLLAIDVITVGKIINK